MRWAGHVARMGDDRGVHRVLVGKSERKRPLGRPRRKWEDNIKMDKIPLLKIQLMHLLCQHQHNRLTCRHTTDYVASDVHNITIRIALVKNWETL
jgi:hypothetical protein